MLEILMINVDRFVHTVLESMGLTKKLMFREKLDGVNALNVVRPLCIASELRLDLTRVSLNKRVVSLSKKLNFADEQNEHAATEGTTKLSKILSRSISASHSNTLMQDVDAKIIRRAVEARAKSTNQDRMRKRNGAQTASIPCPMATASRDADATISVIKKYMRLCTENAEFLRRNIGVSLHIAIKETRCKGGNISEARYRDTLSLCSAAILCLIEPSERAFVRLEDNLSAAIAKYLSRGCSYRFDTQRNYQGSYVGLLILSPWAKVLVRRPDATVLQTIQGILECGNRGILVLCYPEEVLRKEGKENHVYKRNKRLAQFR